ncbi:mitochondrial ribosomal death-associated protein 3-domain-containing protein [Syncephalis pseudoplumigaleata]|uniref:Small ribosomal subunit protein mS29 n=1 Tax=Syncephalis pseudoplumigaleata TaxID=1712513 RepID=A0A4V1J1M4_9FUNG|nr:mitochondrial ribosomal death-associated protein 3-domain-containing protein [Syncephalis pseudoplumigaleata]|eukprot:RKP25569.1 mitochondrial ribosomal death-associated protein 3-domain-containing protein [Syncephalis pseudoplumigaleata]
MTRRAGVRIELNVERPTVHLREFQPELLDEQAIGETMRLPADTVARIEASAAGYPKDLYKDFQLTYNDALMVRESTLKLLKIADAVNMEASAHMRLLLTITWVNGSTAYAPMENTEPLVYAQPALTTQVLHRFKQMNTGRIDEILLAKDYDFGAVKLTTKDSLAQLIDAGIANEALGAAVWRALLDELANNPSVPSVLVAVDQVNALYTKADYHHANGEALMPHELHLAKPLLDLLNGSRVLQRGLVVGAMSLRDVRYGRATPTEKSSTSNQLHHFPIEAFSSTEVLAMLDYYYRAQVVFEEPTSSMAITKYTVTQGNARELLHSCLNLL